MSTKSKGFEKSYELLLILAGSLSESETKKQLKKWEAEITKIGKILEKTIWEKRTLAYKIKKETTGNYLIIHFESLGEQLAELDNALRLSSKVIRHFICKTPKNYEWNEYSDENLEHDFTKLKPVEKKDEKEFIKKSFAKKLFTKKEAKKTTPKKAETEGVKTVKKANVGEIDKKLDDILADL